MKHLHLTTDLVTKIDEVEFLYIQDRMNAVRDFKNEPDCVKYIKRENLRAAMLPSISNPFLIEFYCLVPSPPPRLVKF